MNELQVVDQTFDLNFASEYHLSIQIGLDGFSFCVLNAGKKKIIVFRHFPFAVGNSAFLAKKSESVFEQEPRLNAAYRSVSVSYHTTKSTLIPKNYSDSLLTESIGMLAFDRKKSEEILTNSLSDFNMQITFGIPKDLLALLNRKYSDFRLTHHVVQLLHSANRPGDDARRLVFIHFEKKYFCLVVLKASQIVLYNNFFYRNESDFLYHTLNCCDKLQVDPENDVVLVSGFVADESNYIKQLKKYLSSVSFMKPNQHVGYMNIFDKVQKHQFATLLNNFPCEL